MIPRANDRSIMLNDTNDPNQNHQMAPLQADYQAVLQAPVPTVFNAVANHDQYCQLMPNLKHVHFSEPDAIRSCDFGNDMILQEKIILWKPPSTYAYTALTPNPFGIWEHYAEVRCEPHQDGTYLRWQHYFKHDDLAAMLILLNQMFDEIFGRLFKQFDGRRLA
ncbi:MAG: SRPBCC family protein [Chloroflexota bacterium]